MASFLWEIRPYFRQVAGQLVLGSLAGIVMNTAVATKIPMCSPDVMRAGNTGPNSGRNNAGLEFAMKNSSNGPISSASLRIGLS